MNPQGRAYTDANALKSANGREGSMRTSRDFVGIDKTVEVAEALSDVQIPLTKLEPVP